MAVEMAAKVDALEIKLSLVRGHFAQREGHEVRVHEYIRAGNYASAMSREARLHRVSIAAHQAAAQAQTEAAHAARAAGVDEAPHQHAAMAHSRQVTELSERLSDVASQHALSLLKGGGSPFLTTEASKSEIKRHANLMSLDPDELQHELEARGIKVHLDSDDLAVN